MDNTLSTHFANTYTSVEVWEETLETALSIIKIQNRLKNLFVSEDGHEVAHG